MSLFFSPAKSEGFIWGLGPILQFPTGTDEVLSSRKWAAGPAGVGLIMQGPWVVGILANNTWSYAGEQRSQRSRACFCEIYFVNYNLPHGWYLTSSPIITANWKAEGKGNKWTVPVGGGFGKVFRINRRYLQRRDVAAFSNVVRPDGGADWTLRLQLTLITSRRRCFPIKNDDDHMRTLRLTIINHGVWGKKMKFTSL